MLTVEANNLDVGYGGEPVVKDVSFELASGQSVLIIGHNGAGKSTILKTLWGLLEPVQGQCSVLGLPVGWDRQDLMQRGARFLGQGARGFGGLSVGSSRRVLERLYGCRCEAASTISSAGSPVSRISDLSLGQRKMEALQLLSCGEPKLFLLDEPTAGLDAASASRIRAWHREAAGKGVSFAIVEHGVRSWLPQCDLALVVRGRRVSFFGSSSELRNPEKLASVYL